MRGHVDFSSKTTTRPNRACRSTVPFRSSHNCSRKGQCRNLSCVKLFAESNSSEEREMSNLDVSEAVVQPKFRSTPWEAEKREFDDRETARIVFVSESNVCRSVLAQGIFAQLLEGSPLEGQVIVESRGTRDYNLGEPAERSAEAAAAEMFVPLPQNFAAQKFDYEGDTVKFDLILVMDKYTAADVMREISVYDTINKEGRYTEKVRRLGEFHPILSREKGSDAQDIDDPLYGNAGGPAELEAVRSAAVLIRDSCEGVIAFLELARSRSKDTPLPQLVRQEMVGMEQLDWLVPPMLQRR